MTAIMSPCDAELIQTACRRAREGTLSTGSFADAECSQVSMVHLYQEDAFLLVSDECVVTSGLDAGLPAMVEVIDHAPVAMRERVRSLVWLSGTLHEVPAELERELAVEIASEHPEEQLLDVGHGRRLIRMAVDTAVIATQVGACSVDSEALARAEPDAFWEYEAGWLQHLDSDHRDLIHQLSQRLPDEVRGGRIHPLRLDRFGITLRVEVGDRDEDVRMSFSRPVRRVPELSAAIHALALHPCLEAN